MITQVQRKQDFISYLKSLEKDFKAYGLNKSMLTGEAVINSQATIDFGVSSFFDITDSKNIDKLHSWALTNKTAFPYEYMTWVAAAILKHYKDYLTKGFGISSLFSASTSTSITSELPSEEKLPDKEDSEACPSAPAQPLNLILYGPPGTGKTYHTIDKAVEVIDGFDPLRTHENAKKRFDELKTKGQIVFTTFHQSMSYEDFIEGIKPVLDGASVGYKIENGIFKELCQKSMLLHIPSFEILLEYLKMEISTGIITTYETATKSNHISLSSKGEILYHTGSTPRTESDENMKLMFDDLSKRKIYDISSYSAPNLDSLIEKLTKGKTKNVDTAECKWTLSKLLELYEWAITPKIIIIDEINRGNVANIFGELITLIEEDKRLYSNKEEMTCKLPYSKEKFGVPTDIYIIGTMNTADRSVEALDSALRRRFSFVEMMPNSELLKNTSIKGTGKTLADLLTTINERIEVLKDREHQIGHSYFAKYFGLSEIAADDLKGVFTDKIIPLLQEYFYGDYEKIQLVIGNEFVEEVESLPDFAGFKDYDNPQEKRYLINSRPDMEKALRVLFNIKETGSLS